MEDLKTLLLISKIIDYIFFICILYRIITNTFTIEHVIYLAIYALIKYYTKWNH